MQEQFQEALRLHQQGDLMAAEKIYRELLDRTPDAPAAPDVLHALGVLCQQKGQHQDAEACFKKALTRNPDAADTHFNLGAVRHQQKKFDAAVESYRRAIELDPKNTGMQYNLAGALLTLGRYEEAIAAYRHFLDQAPDSESGHYNLGLALSKAFRFKEAIAAYRSALEQRPDFPEALSNLGALLMETGHSDEALTLYRQALERKPDLAQAHYNLGNALMRLGHFEEAEAIFRNALGQWPRFGGLHLRLANLKSFSPEDPALAAMEKECASPALDDSQKAIFHFAIGKAYEDCEDYDRAFDSFEKGNALKHATLAFDHAGEEALTNRIIATFNKARLTDHGGQGAAGDKPIFLLGMPRSGAALVEQILATHSSVHGASGHSELAHRIGKLGAESNKAFPEAVCDMKAEAFARFGQDCIDAMTHLAPDATRITDKWLLNFRNIGLIHLALPHAKILHCVRNPVDTALSCYKNLFDDEMPFAYDLTELGQAYKLYERLMNHWHAMLPGRILDVPYESLVADPETHIRAMLDFCDLPWEANCLDFYKTERPVQITSVARVRQPMTTKAIRRWRKYEHRLTPLLEALA